MQKHVNDVSKFFILMICNLRLRQRPQQSYLACGVVTSADESHHLCVVANGAYYTVDRGVEPHYFFGKPESYFDRDALTEFINNLK